MRHSHPDTRCYRIFAAVKLVGWPFLLACVSSALPLHLDVWPGQLRGILSDLISQLGLQLVSSYIVRF